MLNEDLVNGVRSSSCPICLERIAEPRILACRHVFCKKCLVSMAKLGYIASNRVIVCPVCRTEIKLGRRDLDSLRGFVQFILPATIKLVGRVHRPASTGLSSRHDVATAGSQQQQQRRIDNGHTPLQHTNSNGSTGSATAHETGLLDGRGLEIGLQRPARHSHTATPHRHHREPTVTSSIFVDEVAPRPSDHL